MARRRFQKAYSGATILRDPLASVRSMLGGYADPKVVLARKLLRQGKSIKDLIEPLGYKNASSVVAFLKRNNIPRPPRGHQGKPVPSYQEIKQRQMEKVMKISPDWGPEAARLRFQEKKSVEELAKRFNVSTSRIYQVTNVLSGTSSPKTTWVKDAWRMIQNGQSVDQVAKHFDKSVYRVRDAVANLRRAQKAQMEAKEIPVSDRQFDPVRNYKNPATGALMNGVMIRCGVEGCENKDYFLKAHGVVNPVHAAQVFRNRGWGVGNGPRADRCPDHMGKLGTHEPEKKPKPIEATAQHRPSPDATEGKREEALAESVAKAEAPKAEAPKEDTPRKEPLKTETAEKPMSRTERRIVFAKLEEVYLDEKTGYREDWSDAKVAEDLGVPVAWIAEIRDENFGPAKSAADVRKALEEARTKGEVIEKMGADLKASLDAFNEDVRAFDEKVRAFDASMEDFDRRMRAFFVEAEAFAKLYRTIT